MNVVVLRGTLPRDPELRQLKSGSCVLNFDVTTREVEGRAETAPVAWIEPPAAATSYGAGDDVVVVGTVRRRFFRTPSGIASRTEVVADQVMKASHAKRARTAIGKVADAMRADEALAGTG